MDAADAAEEALLGGVFSSLTGPGRGRGASAGRAGLGSRLVDVISIASQLLLSTVFLTDRDLSRFGVSSVSLPSTV